MMDSRENDGKNSGKNGGRKGDTASQREADQWESCLKERLAEIAQLHRKNTELYQKLSQEEEACLRESQRKKELEGQVRSGREREKKLKKELDRLKAEAESQRRQWEQETEMLRQKIQQMENSRSWKLTKPLRAFLWRVKGVQ